MFQYTNTIILNSNLDSSGKPKWTSQENNLNVKRVMKFVKDNVQAIYKRVANDPVLSKAEFTMVNSGAGVYR